MEWLPEDEYDAGPVAANITSGDTALVVVDMQYLDAHPDFGIGRSLAESGESAKAEHYFASVERIVPRIARLLEAARDADIPVIHTRLCSRAPDGRDRTPLHKARGWTYPEGSKETEFLPEVAPQPSEIVLDKTTSGAFASTGIDQLLRNLGVGRLIVAGVDTCYCVETTVRAAADHGYEVILVGDACATKTAEMQAAALRRLRAGYCRVYTTRDVVDALQTGTGRAAVDETATGA